MTFFPQPIEVEMVPENTVIDGIVSGIVQAETRQDNATVEALYELADRLGLDVYDAAIVQTVRAEPVSDFARRIQNA